MLCLVSCAVNTGDFGLKASEREGAGCAVPATRFFRLGVTTGSTLSSLLCALCPPVAEFNVEDAVAGEFLPCHSTCALIDGLVP